VSGILFSQAYSEFQLKIPNTPILLTTKVSPILLKAKESPTILTTTKVAPTILLTRKVESPARIIASSHPQQLLR
jgi:hypothetical protein